MNDRIKVALTVKESEFTTGLVNAARFYKWMVHHSSTAQWGPGRWATPLQGTPGLPDLILLRSPRLIFAELKTVTGIRRISKTQQQWLNGLQDVSGIEVYLWTPLDWPRIHEILGRAA